MMIATAAAPTLCLIISSRPTHPSYRPSPPPPFPSQPGKGLDVRVCCEAVTLVMESSSFSATSGAGRLKVTVGHDDDDDDDDDVVVHEAVTLVMESSSFSATSGAGRLKVTVGHDDDDR
jgi:hypothetical protein